MTMLSFPIEGDDAADAQVWADRLGISRSEFLREAIHRHLIRLSAEDDGAAWTAKPLIHDEQSLAGIADWGQAENWSEWVDATG